MTAEIAVFSRAPLPGRAKRRLVPALGEKGAADLQRRMTAHAVSVAVESGTGDVTVWCTPNCLHPSFRALANRYPIRLRKQRGHVLGARMGAAMQDMLSRRSCALLTGSDCPGMRARHLRDAAGHLAGGADAVLGPALDGGYVLIGLRRYDASLFSGLDWGTDRVLAETRRRLVGLGWRWRELEPVPDIDRPEDLVHLDVCTYDVQAIQTIKENSEKAAEPPGHEWTS